MNGDQNFQAGEQQGMIISELKSLKFSVDQLREGMEKSQNKIWPKIESHGQSIKVLEDRVSDLKRAKNWTISLILGGVAGAALRILLK